MKTWMVVGAAWCTVLVLGCGGGRNETPAPAARTGTEAPAIPPTGDGHAPATVVPGSHEDWCAEHEVAESQCTRCDPSLIPAFQASGDWDAEHGLPMSQCKIHNPNLEIVRPPKPEGS
jgi:hypothetical protein